MSSPERQLFPDAVLDEPIPCKQAVVRYMSLPTLIMILTGRVFIPSIKKLQETDPFESLLPFKWIANLPELCTTLQEPENADWLEKRDGKKDGSAMTWLRELTVRRCVWCWCSDPEESMGLWNNYGSGGVAVISTVERVRQAFLQMAHTTGTSVGKVRYVSREGIGNEPNALYRPYYFKQKCYAYEKEIRFVIGSHAGDTNELGGDLFPVDPEKLIEEIILSPRFRFSEAMAIDRMLREKFPQIPVSMSPLLSLDELPEIRPAAEVNINLVSTDPFEKRLFGVV